MVKTLVQADEWCRMVRRIYKRIYFSSQAKDSNAAGALREELLYSW